MLHTPVSEHMVKLGQTVLCNGCLSMVNISQLSMLHTPVSSKHAVQTGQNSATEQCLTVYEPKNLGSCRLDSLDACNRHNIKHAPSWILTTAKTAKATQ
jgi:hypothetical protein